jgi:hypothetical protein
LHGDIAAVDSRIDDFPTSKQHQELVERQQKLQNDFNTFNTTFSGFSNHFYPAPVPPPQFYPHQPFYPPPPPPPQMDD